MHKNYYYLISSLEELSLENNKLPTSNIELINFCTEELSTVDLTELKKIYLFNDIRNCIYHKDENFTYLLPSYYTEEEFKDNLKDTDTFFIFLAEYFYYKKNEKRLFPELGEIDEIVMLLYKYLNDFTEGFIKEYFLFELELQNITSALSLRSNDLSFSNKVIPADEIAEKILKSNANDLGLSGTVSYIDELVEVYKTNDLIKIEKAIESIRWKWLEEMLGFDYFSNKAVFVYAIKLISIERWANMNDQKGEEILNGLIEKIGDNVKFSEEFARR